MPLLTLDIEYSISAGKKVGTVFANLTAAYNTVGHRSSPASYYYCYLTGTWST